MDKRRLIKTLTLLFVITAIFGITITIAATQIGKIEFTGEILVKSSMSPSTIPIALGTIAPSSTKTVASADSGSDLTVNTITDITATLSGHSPFTAFSVTIELKQLGTTKYSATVHEAATSYTISSVAVGTYDIFVGYSYTAGGTPTTIAVSVALSYP